MITVSEQIKQAYNKSTVQADRIRIGNNFYAITNVVYSDDCYNEGNVFGTAMGRILTFDIETAVAMEMKEFEYQTGVVINGVINFISLGNFIVTDTGEGDTTDITHVTAIDYMLKTNIIYETNLNYSTATLLDVLQEVCDNCGITLGTTTFTNSSFTVDSNQFNPNTLCREVIQAVAQVSGTIAKIKPDNKLYLINPNLVENVSHVFETNQYSEAEIKRLTHPINVVSLTESEITGENVTMRDEESIARDGENSIIINDNPFAYNQDKRQQLITGLFNAIKGFEYKSYALKFQMLPWIESLDKVQIKDMQGNTYNSYVFRFEYKSPDGVTSTIEAPSLIKATIEYQNIPDALDIARRTEIIVDKQNQVITSVVQNVDEQNTKIARVEQTVDELNSKISDIADITTSQESNTGRLLFDSINQSEPIRIEIRPLGDNISYLYPFEALYPSNDLYIKLRTLRFTNTETNEVFDYELPDDLLYYDNEHYDEFILDYDAQTCTINKKCGYNNNGQVVLLSEPRTVEYTFPHIELTDGDYKVEILKYDNVPYGAYLFCRLMAQNIYTTQFATKAEMNSEISQTKSEIGLSVDEKLTSYSTTSEMNAAINVKANQITSQVSETYETKSNANTNYSSLTQRANSIESTVSQKVGNNEVISKINQSAEAVTINANKISLSGKTINMTSDNIAINSTNFKVDKNGNLTCSNANVNGKITSSNATITGGNINVSDDGNDLTGNINATNKYNSSKKSTLSSKSLYVQNGEHEIGTISSQQFGIIKDDYNGNYIDAIYGTLYNSDYGVNTRLVVRNSNAITSIYPDRIVANGTTYNSKESLKKNIKLYDKKVLDLIKNSEIYEYNYKSEKDTDKKHIGFVIADKGGNYKTPEEVISAEKDGIEQYNMTSLLWKAVQEQQAEIEKLKQRLEEKQNG